MKHFFLLTALFSIFSIHGQIHQDYDSIIKQAWNDYQSKDYKSSALNYSKAFSLNGLGFDDDRYNAACSWALTENIDSAFYYLNKVTFRENNKGYSNYDHITKDTDLTSLYKDSRWEPLLIQVKANKTEIEKDYDHDLVKLLDSIHNEDQFYRRQIDSIKTNFGWQSDEMKAHWKIINEKSRAYEYKENEVMGVMYNDIIPVIVKALQEQQIMIEKQQQEIELLKKELKTK